jgi:16S rRNA (cytosine1402-N4)-methyltransferase
MSGDDEPAHTSVLLEEVLEALQPRGGIGYRALDCTVGAGGHALALLQRSSPDGQLVGLDADADALELARYRLAEFGDRVTLVRRNFGDLAELGLEPMNAILFDLGLSSMQLDQSGRGFSFRLDEPLDMRFGAGTERPTAAELLNTLSEAELEHVVREYGEEPRARRVAREVVRRRPLGRTGELVAAVMAALGPARGRIHPATRTFQALRIAVNDELGVLERGLDAAIGLLLPGGRVAAISFHSLEDRIVKWRMRGWADQGLARVITKKPLQPQSEEARANPRARSAKLRVAERLGWR